MPDILILFVRVYVQGSDFFSKTSTAVSLCKQYLTRCPFSREKEQVSGKKEKAAVQCRAKMDALHILNDLTRKQFDMQDPSQFASFNQYVPKGK